MANQNFNIDLMNAKKQNIPVLNPFYQVQSNAIVNFHPHLRRYIKKFFSRHLKWTRRLTPTYVESNKNRSTFNVINTNFRDTYQAQTKERNNIKKFPLLSN
jgi:hypothetical protein